MRELSVGEAAAIVAPEGCWIFANMRVQNFGGQWLNLGALAVGEETLEFFNDATIQDDIDRNTLQMSATFAREIGNASLVPFRSDSPVNNYGGDYQPALDLHREWDLWVAVVDRGTTPANEDYRQQARGIVDRIDVAGDPAIITIQGRGPEADLIDQRIIWSDTVGVPLSSTTPKNFTGGDIADVLQAILDDQLGGGAVTLTVDPSAPSYFVNDWPQTSEVGLFDLLTQIASLPGASLRYRYDSSDNLTLTLFTPNRSPSTPDWTLDQERGGYEKLDVGIGLEGVRNYVVVQYADEDFGTQVVTSPPSPFSPSISRYGKRTLTISLAGTTQVTTEAAAGALADAIRGDLEFPILEQAMEATGYWFAELWDYVEFQENGIHYNENQFGGVISLSQRYANGSLKTGARFKAKPAGRYRGWLDFGPAAPRTPFTPAMVSLDAAFEEWHTPMLAGTFMIQGAGKVNDYTQSVTYELSADIAFATILQTLVTNATPGAGNLAPFSILDADRVDTYFLRARPFSGPKVGSVSTGVEGIASVATARAFPAPTDTATIAFDLTTPGQLKANLVGSTGTDPGTIGGVIASGAAVDFFNYLSDAEVLENIPAAQTEIARADGVTALRRAALLAGAGSFRWEGYVTEEAPGSEVIRPRYSTDGSTFTDLTEPELPLSIPGVVRSDWVPIPSGMAGDVDVAPATFGGDDTGTAKLSSLVLRFSFSARTGGGTTPGGGGGGGGCGVVLATPYDDDFNCGSVIDETGARFGGANPWTPYNAGIGFSQALSGDKLIFTLASSGGIWNPRGDTQPMPAGDCAFETTCRVTTSGFANGVGLMFVETATGKYFLAQFMDVFGLLVGAGHQSSMGAYGATSVGALDGKIELARVGSNIVMRYDIGAGWVTMATVAQTTAFTTAPDLVGVYAAPRRDAGSDAPEWDYFYKTG